MVKVNLGGNGTIEILEENENLQIIHNGNKYLVSKLSEDIYDISTETGSSIVEIKKYDPEMKSLSVKINHKVIEVAIKDHHDEIADILGIDTKKSKSFIVKAPMPGVITQIIKSSNDSINKGDAIVVLEAMKMENVIKAPENGILKNLSVKNGQSIGKNDIICEIIPEE